MGPWAQTCYYVHTVRDSFPGEPELSDTETTQRCCLSVLHLSVVALCLRGCFVFFCDHFEALCGHFMSVWACFESICSCFVSLCGCLASCCGHFVSLSVCLASLSGCSVSLCGFLHVFLVS